ncbi:MAG: GNAT family N-acetyltransferase [Gemmatimonadota bacterium]
MTAVATAAATIRPLTRDDLGAVVAIDAALEGRSRRAYIERRLAAALREPKLHAQFAAADGAGLAGYILARVLEGEFGRTQPGLRLELVGVRSDSRGHGVGRQLFDALAQWARRHGIHDIRTAVLWRDSTMLHWLDAMGFELAPQQIIDCPVDGGAYRPERDDAIALPEGEGPGHEIDFGARAANDYERLARDTADVRSMTPADLQEIARIDRNIIGRDRSGYIAARLGEAMQDSAIRVSLTARCDGVIVGYLMARADLGDFGRTEPVAVIDTLGIDPEYAHRGIGHALMSQLFANLGALRVERVETIVAHRAFDLLGFFYHCGFAPSQRLPFARRLD